MALQEKPLGQLRPGNTNAITVYNPAVNVRGIIKTILVCNTSTGAATFRLFLDAAGTTFDETTALYWDAVLAAHSTVQIDTFLALESPGHLAVRSGVVDALTFTVHGAEVVP